MVCMTDNNLIYKTFSILQNPPDRLWSTLCLIFNGKRGSFPGERNRGEGGCDSDHACLSPTLRINGTTPLLPTYVFVTSRRTTSPFYWVKCVMSIYIMKQAGNAERLVFVRCPSRISKGRPFTLLNPPSNFRQSRYFKLGRHLSLSHSLQLHVCYHPLTEG